MPPIGQPAECRSRTPCRADLLTFSGSRPCTTRCHADCHGRIAVFIVGLTSDIPRPPRVPHCPRHRRGTWADLPPRGLLALPATARHGSAVAHLSRPYLCRSRRGRLPRVATTRARPVGRSARRKGAFPEPSRASPFRRLRHAHAAAAFPWRRSPDRRGPPCTRAALRDIEPRAGVAGDPNRSVRGSERVRPCTPTMRCTD